MGVSEEECDSVFMRTQQMFAAMGMFSISTVRMDTCDRTVQS